MPKMIQLRNVPDDLHRTLKVRAAQARQTLSDYLISEIRTHATRPTPEEMRQRLAAREPVVTSISSAEAVRSERDGR